MFGKPMFRDMATNINILKPPDCVKKMKQLDKKLFDKMINVPCIHFKDIKVSKVLPIFKKYLLKIENWKPIQNESEGTRIYLNPEIVEEWTSLSEETRKSAEILSLSCDNFKIIPKKLSYENYSIDDILKAILPEGEEGSSSFTKIGHIVHINLREHLILYKSVIGNILYDKVPGCKTVVNKTNIIDNTYRNFQMEILHGDDDMTTKVKENGCYFQFDFAKVYWNSRLCTEHERIVKVLKPDDVLFDVFAGVGPFSIPAAKKNCLTFANDLNPESYKWLNYNSKLNKIDPQCLKSYNKDGKYFILEDIKQNLTKYTNKNIYITMNLPALATEFLKYFVNLFSNEEIPDFATPPIIFLYCFAKGEDYNAIARKLVIENIGFDINDKILDLFRVRTVSSLKEMMRVTIKLDKDILTGKLSKINKECSTNCNKKRKFDESDQ